MKIRHGVFCIYKGVEMSVIEYYGHGLSLDLELNHRVLAYSSEYGHLEGFQFDEVSKKFKKDILIKELSNAFKVTTKALFKGKEFLVEPYYGDKTHIHISTKDLVLGKELGFFELHDGFGNPYYLGEVKILDLEKVWEEYSPSTLDLPMPNNLPNVRVLEIQKLN